MKKILISFFLLFISITVFVTSTYSWMTLNENVNTNINTQLEFNNTNKIYTGISPDSLTTDYKITFTSDTLLYPISISKEDDIKDKKSCIIGPYGNYIERNSLEGSNQTSFYIKSSKSAEVYFDKNFELDLNNNSKIVGSKEIYFRNALRMGIYYYDILNKDNYKIKIYEYDNETNLGSYGGENNFALDYFHNKMINNSAYKNAYLKTWDNNKITPPENGPTTISFDSTDPILELEKETIYYVFICIWLEGNDADCVFSCNNVESKFVLEVISE